MLWSNLFILPMKTKITIILVAIILLFIALAGLAFWRWQNQSANSQDKIYSKLVTPEDRKPLAISPNAIKNNRTLTIPILMYHHVGDLPKGADKIRSDLTVPTASFEAQVQWLKNRGYQSVSLNDIYLASQGKFTMPKKPVVFTFDDGYEDVFQNAAPILKKYGYSGSFAVITKNPGTAAGDNVYAPWPDIAAAYLAGNEIVSHTQTHFDGSNPKFSANYIYAQLNGSVADINQHLGFTTNILIYPYGHYTDTYIAQAKKAGFVMGVTVHKGKLLDLDNLMQIPRIRVHGAETLDKFEKIITE